MAAICTPIFQRVAIRPVKNAQSAVDVEVTTKAYYFLPKAGPTPP